MDNGAVALSDRRALVTGASSGIGRATALRLAMAGAEVAVNHYSSGERSAAENVVAEIERAGGKALAIQADVGDEAQVVRMFNDVVRTLGGIDILVNNAGIEIAAPVLDMTLDVWDRVIRTNLTGAFLCTREAGRRMAEQGRGVIVNISSVHESAAWPGYAHYCASKAGLKLLMQTAAGELAPAGVRVANIAPGAIHTSINDFFLNDPQALQKVLDDIPMARLGHPDEIAAAVVWLAGDEASYITGTTLVIDGGSTLGQ
jgi:glucose 1-dehydrogenase